MDQREATWATEKYLQSIGGGEGFILCHHYKPPKERLAVNLSGSQVRDETLAHVIELMENQRRYGDISKVVRPLIEVQDLTLSETSITNEGLRLLEDFKHVEVLRLTGTHVSDDGLCWLKHLHSLEELWLCNTDVSGRGLTHLKNTRLTLLGLNPAPVDDEGLSGLAELTHLEWLNLVGTRITGSGFASLRHLTSLKSLFLEHTRLEDSSLRHIADLSGLRLLDLADTLISDGALPHLSKMTQLHELHLGNTRLSKKGYTALRKALPGVKVSRTRPWYAGGW